MIGYSSWARGIATAPTKDESRRLHPSLQAYDALTEQVKEYDRVFVRQTQRAVREEPDD